MNPLRPSPTTPWSDPIPLPAPPPLPTLDTGLIPNELRPWITDAALRYGVPAESIFVPALTAAGTAAGNTRRIHPKANDATWSEAPNLYGLLIAPPSTKKTPALKEGLRFLNALEAHHVAEWAKDASWRRTHAHAASHELKEITNTLAEEQDEAALLDLRSRHDAAQARLDAAEAGPRRYMVMDATVEKASMLMSQDVNRGGLLLVRDEFSGLLAQMRRSGHENDRSFYLEGYNGTGSYTTDRVSRDNTSIPVFTLSMAGTIQPTQIEPLIRAARKQHVDDGFVERMQLSVWIHPDRCGLGLDQNPDTAAMRQASRVFDGLASDAAHWEQELGRYEYVGVHYTEAAQQHIDDWNHLKHDEAQTANREGHVAFASHLGKSPAAVARIALIFHRLGEAVDGKRPAVSLDHATSATRLMDFFHAHARRTYQAHLPPTVDLLAELMDLINAGAVHDGMTLRDLQRHHRVLGKGKEAQLVVLRAAEGRNWLRIGRVPNGRAKSSLVIHLNPKLIND